LFWADKYRYLLIYKSIILKRLFFIASFLIAGYYLNASPADSLRRELSHTKTNEDKVHLSFLLGRFYADRNPDSAAVFYKQVIALAGPATFNAPSMEAACAKAYLLKETDGEGAKKQQLFALQCARKIGRRDMESYIMVELAALSWRVSDYYIALDYYKRAMKLEVDMNNRARQAMLWSRIGGVYTTINDFPSAFNAYNEALVIEDSLKRLNNISAVYGDLAVVFSKQRRFAEALKYCDKDDSIMTVLGEPDVVLLNQTTRGIIYKNMGNYSGAIALYKKILDKPQVMDSFQQMSLYHNLAVAMGLNKQFKEADANFNKATDINQRIIHSSWFSIQNNMEWARTKLLEHNTDGAIFYAREAERIVNESNASKEEQKDIMALLSEIYRSKGDMNNAYAYYKKYSDLQDTIFHTEESKNLAEAETRLNLAEKDNQVAELYRQNELQRLKTQKENIINISLIAGLVLVIALVLVMVRAYRRTLHQNLQLTRQKEVIDQQVQQLAAAGTMKSRFFANISHELRTPVTILTGMLELLQDKITSVKEKEKLAAAFNNSRKLQRMVEEMLDLSRMESGLPVYKKEQLEIRKLTRRIVYAFETLMDQKGITLSYVDEIGDDVFVLLDEDKYEKIINNLLYNAIKFNKPAGAVRIGLSLSPGKVLISIEDSGYGITPADLPHIFDRFYQGTTSIKPASPGSGIGLSLVKEFTVMQGGEVSVSSVPGEGAAFLLTFPIVEKAAEEKEDILEEDAIQPEIIWQKLEGQPEILIVEDNAEMRYYLREILSGKGNVSEAGNGVEALKYLEEHKPDLIISDVMMPEMDGEAFLGHLKSSGTWCKIPVIMLTALATKEDQLRMLSMGVDDYILKPFNAEELKIRVYNLLRNQAVRQEWIEKPIEPDEVVQVDKGAVELQEKIQSYVSERLRETSLSVHDLAYHLALSERQLYRLSNTLTGCTPAQLIKEVRLKKAYDMLIAGDVYKVEDLARRVGFENSSYFSRQFMARFGKRPTEYL
jgi:signal transduction histidine kinase/DNA-binding response OmpR family regulator